MSHSRSKKFSKDGVFAGNLVCAVWVLLLLLDRQTDHSMLGARKYSVCTCRAVSHISCVLCCTAHVTAVETAQQHVGITRRLSRHVCKQPLYAALDDRRLNVWISASERLSHVISVHRPTTPSQAQLVNLCQLSATPTLTDTTNNIHIVITQWTVEQNVI